MYLTQHAPRTHRVRPGSDRRHPGRHDHVDDGLHRPWAEAPVAHTERDRAMAALGLTSRAATHAGPSRSPPDCTGPPATSPDPVILLGLRI